MEPLALGDPRQAGSYQLLARLGAGGFGRVFLGFSEGGRPVAVKLIHDEFARDPEFVTRFRREVLAAQAVNGAFTAPVLTAGPEDNPPWLATAYVTGPSLADAVREVGPLPERAVWKLAGGLAEALQAVHASRLVHRDLTPGNVLLAADGPRVIDFGISRAADETVLTASGMIIGTPGFVSPEQATRGEATPASDIFCLGSVLAFAGSGTLPFGPGRRDEVLYRVVHAEPDLTGVPGALRGLIARCLSKDPARRPSPAEVVAAARRGLGSAPVAWPASVTELVRRRDSELNAVLRSGSVPPLPSTITRPAGSRGRAGRGGPAPAPHAPFPTPARQPVTAAAPGRHRPRGFLIAALAIVIVAAGAYGLGREGFATASRAASSRGTSGGGAPQQPASGQAPSHAAGRGGSSPRAASPRGSGEDGYVPKYTAKAFTMAGDDGCSTSAEPASSATFAATGPQVSASDDFAPTGDLDMTCSDDNGHPGIDFEGAGAFAKVSGSPGVSGCVSAITTAPAAGGIDLSTLTPDEQFCVKAASGLIVLVTLDKVDQTSYDLSWTATAWQPPS